MWRSEEICSKCHDFITWLSASDTAEYLHTKLGEHDASAFQNCKLCTLLFEETCNPQRYEKTITAEYDKEGLVSSLEIVFRAQLPEGGFRSRVYVWLEKGMLYGNLFGMLLIGWRRLWFVEL